MKIISRVLFIASFVGVALAGEWNCAATSGTFTLSNDCTVSSQVVVTSSLNITGIPNANGVLPKIIGGGSNRLFKVESGGELVVKSLNLTGGVASGSTNQDKRGGAIFVSVNGDLVVLHCIFRDNDSTYSPKFGDSIYLDYLLNGASNKIIKIENCIFERASGVCSQEIMVHEAQTAIVRNCTFHQTCGTMVFVAQNGKATILDSSGKGGSSMKTLEDSGTGKTPTMTVINFDSSGTLEFIGNCGTNTDEVCNLQTCLSAPTQCTDNGYPNAICTTRQNPDEGVICAQNCSAGYQKAGTLNHTCAACPSGTYNPLWNQYQCQSWSECSSGQYISTNGTSSSDRVCSSCPPQQFSANNNAYACTTWSSCTTGEYVSSNGTNTTDRVCTPCGAGAYSASANEDSCTPWTNCTTGQHISTNGTSTSNRVCSSCTAGKYSTSANAFSCTAWTTCTAGQKIAANGTATTDRTCVTCFTGQFSAATNQNACTNWTTCNATTEVESSAGSATADRVCAFAGSPSPSPAGSPSPSGDSPSPAADSPAPAGHSPSPAGSSPSPAGSSPSPTGSPSTTAAPNELSAASHYRPHLYLCGVLMVSMLFLGS